MSLSLRAMEKQSIVHQNKQYATQSLLRILLSERGVWIAYIVRSSLFYFILYEMKHPTKHWFTLIEIIIVLIIIMILLGTMLRTSNNFARNLEFKNQKEEFVWYFNKIVTTAMSSNHNRKGIFTGIQINIGGDSLTYMDNDSHTHTWSRLQFSNLMIDTTNVNSIWLSLTPYQLWCIASPTWSTATFQFSKNETSKSCFRIDLSVCKLSEISCPNLKA